MKRFLFLFASLLTVSGAFAAGMSDDMPSVLGTLYGMTLLLLIIGIYIGLIVLVAKKAKQFHRNATLWVVLCILFNPILIGIILLLLGEDKSALLDDGWER